MTWSSAPEQDEREQQQADQQKDLQRGEPELRLPIELYRENIESYNDNYEDRYPDTDINR